MVSMNAERYVLVVVAVCCVLAAGVAASTLDSSLEQDPDDAVDLDYSLLPVGEDTVMEIQNEADGGGGDPSSGSGSDSETTKQKRADQGEVAEVSQPSEQGDQSGGSSDQGPMSGGGSGDDPGGFGPGDVFTLLDLLWALLPWLILLVLLALAYRYRDRLVALGAAVWSWLSDRTARDGAGRGQWPRTVPSNAIHRGWLRMVGLTDVDRPQSRTTAECQQAAIDQGLDPDAVQSLTDRFREVRYAGEPVTSERVDEVEESLRRIEASIRRADAGDRA